MSRRKFQYTRVVLQFREHVPLLSPVLRNCTLLPNSAYVTACAFARAYVWSRRRFRRLVSRTCVVLSPAGEVLVVGRPSVETFTVALVRKAWRVAGKIAVSRIRQVYAFAFYNARRSSFPRLLASAKERTGPLCPGYAFFSSLNRIPCNEEDIIVRQDSN